jgi:hydrogenase maturation factor
MCVSRFQQVLTVEGVFAEVEDMDRVKSMVSLIALDGPAPEVGDWLVVHSGYALSRAERGEVESVAALIRGADAPGGAGA